MDYRKTITGFLTLVTMLLIACAPKEATSPQVTVPGLVKEGSEKLLLAREAWEVEWDKALQVARKEGKVVVHATSLGPPLKEASPLVKKKFGIDIEIISGRGGELMTRLITERRAGLFRADVLITGSNTFYGETKPGGIVDPLEPVLILPEIRDLKNWYGEDLNWIDEERTAVHMYASPVPLLAINTELVKKDEIKSYYDLLEARWKGKIVMNDGTVAGVGLNGFSVLGWGLMNLDYFRQLAKQEPWITRDQRLMVDWLARGKFHLALFVRSSDMTEYTEAGAPIAYVLVKEGAHLSRNGGATSLVNRAPNPSAARVLINWMLSREGQTIISRAHGIQSARVDVPTEGIEPKKVRQAGVTYFAKAETKEWIARDPEYKKIFLEIFGHLMK